MLLLCPVGGRRAGVLGGLTVLSGENTTRDITHTDDVQLCNSEKKSIKILGNV